MSTEGLRIVSDNSILQIDQDYKNLFLINKQAIPNIASSVSGYYTLQKEDSLLAFNITPKMVDKPEDLYVEWTKGVRGWGNPYSLSNDSTIGLDYDIGQKFYTNSIATVGGFIRAELLDAANAASFGYPPNTYRFNISIALAEKPPDGYTVTVYEFNSLDSSTSSDNFGLQVYDGSADLVFDSSKKPLYISNMYTNKIPTCWLANVGGGNTYLAWNKFDIPYTDPTREYALCILESSQYLANILRNSSGVIYNSGSYSTDYLKFQDSQLRVVRSCINAAYSEDLGSYNGYIFSGNKYPSYMLIDVTNY